MRHGEICTVSRGGDYTGNPRPAVIVQDDGFEGIVSITICPFAIDAAEAPFIRLPIESNRRNGLDASSMVDKVTTVSKRRIGVRVGELDSEGIAQRAMATFLGLTVSQESVR